jgi:hypothetical protein
MPSTKCINEAFYPAARVLSGLRIWRFLAWHQDVRPLNPVLHPRHVWFIILLKNIAENLCDYRRKNGASKRCIGLSPDARIRDSLIQINDGIVVLSDIEPPDPRCNRRR